MSITLPVIDISVATNPFTVVPPSNLQMNQISYIGLLNESPFTLQFMAGGINLPIPAWTNYPIEISRNGRVLSGASLPISVGHTLLTNIDNVPTLLYITFYSPGEMPSSTIPIDLTRQVASTLTNASAVTNTGYAPGTIFISSQVSGEASGQNPVTLTNDAHLNLGDVNYPGDIKVGGQLYTIDINGNGTEKFTDPATGFNELFLYGNRSAPNGIAEIMLSDLSNVSRVDIRGTGTVNLTPTPVSINGGTSGTATVYMDSQGTIKRLLLVLNNFRTGVGAQALLLQSAFTVGAIAFIGGTGPTADNAGIAFLSGGVSQTVRILTALAVGGGTVTNGVGNFAYQNSTATLVTGFDSLQFQGGETASHTGIVYIIGQ